MLTKLPDGFTVFYNLQDPRADGGNKRHSLFDILFITLCATVAGCETYTEVEQFADERSDWFRKFLHLENGIPSHDTIGRVLAALDSHSFQACLHDWIDHLCLDLRGQGVHIDGKTLRHSFDTATNRQALHMVSAWSSGLQVCLGQVATDAKSNEITAVPMLLELLNIEGAVVTLDAMHCQKRTVAKIRDRKAEYLITVKKNQRNLHQAIASQFAEFGEDNYRSPKCRAHRETRTSRGRIEERIVYVAAAPRSLKETGQWADLKTIGMVYRHREADPDSQRQTPEPTSDRVTFFISSLPPKAKLVAGYVNSHWSVETSLHWTLDVTFTEDSSRVRTGTGPEILASLRRIALTILKRDTSQQKMSIRLKRKVAGWSQQAMEAIILGS